MNFLDFFAGIGGFRTGLERVGGICKGFAEIDKYARQSYKAMHDTEGELEWHDITAVTDDDFRRLRGTIDLIAGGFPCQAFSVAGKRMGFDESRGTLFFHIARAAKEIQPRYLLLENVKGLVSHDQGRTLTVILNTLQELGYGHIEWGVFNSKFWGVPQNRERIFIVAELTDEPQQPYLLDLLKDQEDNGVRTRLRDVLESNVDEKYYLSDEKTKGLIEKMGKIKKIKNEPQEFSDGSGISYCIDASYSKGTSAGNVGKGRRTHAIEVRAVLTPDRPEKRQNGRRFKDNDEPMFTLTAQDKHGVLLAQQEALTVAKNAMKSDEDISVKIMNNLNLRPHRNDPSKSGVRSLTLVAHEDNEANTLITAHEPKVYGRSTNYRIRKLTPLECWRLQGFSDAQHQAAAEDGVSDSQRYKQAGNSVTVNVIEAIGAEIQKRMS